MQSSNVVFSAYQAFALLPTAVFFREKKPRGQPRADHIGVESGCQLISKKGMSDRDISNKALMIEHAPAAKDGSGTAYFEDENQPLTIRTTQEDADTRSASVKSFPTPATGWPEI